MSKNTITTTTSSENPNEKSNTKPSSSSSRNPKYPVIDPNPPITKTISNFNNLDYVRFATVTGISLAAGYLTGIKSNTRRASMVTGGLIGIWGGFMCAYQNSSGRLMGLLSNGDEVARYNNK
ncbi:hypothetical protein GIB67_013390 [Kingdonia uniflora]|uniref:NADH-ubiquinone oxidoreductase 21kDa subunit N-terminal domain-containing protein n=1 Tax=Kingdonia uniflora TaxID=39325 RepID=A0A7J7LR40_9MAGN|nr:hypothetical protein GIB67_013390 [Kingdonia uniflora]